MKQYLTDTFLYNSNANKKLLVQISLLPDKEQCIRFFSHLINCQYKWMARIINDPEASGMSWWEPIYEEKELSEKWDDSLQPWLQYINSKTETELSTEVSFIGFDNSLYAATPLDIALQLNYHSIHHRAQMATIIRNQGFEPEFLDYIGTKYRKLDKPDK